MERKDLQRLYKQKVFKANGTTESMIAVLEASMCSDMAQATGERCSRDRVVMAWSWTLSRPSFGNMITSMVCRSRASAVRLLFEII